MGRIYKSVASIIAIFYTGITLEMTGLYATLEKLKHQIFSKTVFIIIAKELNERPPCLNHDYRPQKACAEEIGEFFRKTRQESKKSRYLLLVRKWFYERGFSNCYITRKIDTNEMCSIVWVVTANEIKENRFQNHLPKLKSNEVMLENIYTLENFRGLGIAAITGKQLDGILQRQGFSRIISWFDQNNLSGYSLAGKRGYRAVGRIVQLHFLFMVKSIKVVQFEQPEEIAGPQKFMLDSHYLFEAGVRQRIPLNENKK